MGRSDLVQQQEKNKAFQEYVATQRKAMDADLTKARGELDTLVKEYQSSYPDGVLILTGEYSHLSTVSEWNTKKLNTMIDDIGKSLFGGTPPEPTKKTVPEGLKGTLEAMAGIDLMIATAAFSVIQGILQSLGASMQTEITWDKTSKRVAPGLTIFVAVLENSFKNTDIFSTDTIVENAYIQKVYFSVKDGVAYNKMQDLNLYSEEAEGVRHTIRGLIALSAKLPMPEDPDLLDGWNLKMNKINTTMDGFNKRMEEIGAKIVALGGKPPAPATRAMAARPALGAMPRDHAQAVEYLRQKGLAILGENH